MEIEMLFAKYDLNNDRELDADETKMMLADLDGQRLEIDRQLRKPQENGEDTSGTNTVALASLVSQQDFNGWVSTWGNGRELLGIIFSICYWAVTESEKEVREFKRSSLRIINSFLRKDHNLK